MSRGATGIQILIQSRKFFHVRSERFKGVPLGAVMNSDVWRKFEVGHRFDAGCLTRIEVLGPQRCDGHNEGHYYCPQNGVVQQLLSDSSSLPFWQSPPPLPPCLLAMS